MTTVTIEPKYFLFLGENSRSATHSLSAVTMDTAPLLKDHNDSTKYSSISNLPVNDSSINVKGDYNETHSSNQIVKVDRNDQIEAEGETKKACTVYKRRWYILFAFWGLNFTQAVAWSTWGPIAMTSK